MSHLSLIHRDALSPLNSHLAIASGCDLDQILQHIPTPRLFLEKWQFSTSGGVGRLSGELNVLLHQAGLSDIWVIFTDVIWTSLPLQITHLNFRLTATYPSKSDASQSIKISGYFSTEPDLAIVFETPQTTHVNLFDYIHSDSLADGDLQRLTRFVPCWRFYPNQMSIVFFPRSLTVKSRFPVHLEKISLLRDRLKIYGFRVILEKAYLSIQRDVRTESVVWFDQIHLQIPGDAGPNLVLASTRFPLEQNYLIFEFDVSRNPNLDAILNDLVKRKFFGSGLQVSPGTFLKLGMSLESTPYLYADIRLVLKDQRAALTTRLWLTPDLLLGDIIEPDLMLDHLIPEETCLPRCFQRQKISTCRLVPYERYYTITAYLPDRVAAAEHFWLTKLKFHIENVYNQGTTVRFEGYWEPEGELGGMELKGEYEVQTDQWLAEGDLNAEIDLSSLLQNSVSLEDQRTVMASFISLKIERLEVKIQVDGDWNFIGRAAFEDLELEIEYKYDSASREGKFAIQVSEEDDIEQKWELDTQILTVGSKAVMSEDRRRASLTLS